MELLSTFFTLTFVIQLVHSIEELITGFLYSVNVCSEFMAFSLVGNEKTLCPWAYHRLTARYAVFSVLF